MTKSQNVFSVLMDCTLEKNRISEIHITLENPSDTVQKFLSLPASGEYFGIDAGFDFSALSYSVRSFLAAFKSYSSRVIGRDSPAEIRFETPIENLFLEKMLNFPVQLCWNGHNKNAIFLDEYRALPLGFSPDFQNLILENSNTVLFPGTDADFLLHPDGTLVPILAVVKKEMLSDLFRIGHIQLENEMKSRLFSGRLPNRLTVDKSFKLPAVTEFSDEKIVFYFESPDKEHYLLRVFFSAEVKGKKMEHPFDFSELRKTIMFQEDILIPFSAEALFVCRPDTALYENVKAVLQAVRNCFFEFLNEFERNVITTQDADAVFQKFLPAVIPYIELRDSVSKLDFMHQAIEEKQVAFSPSGTVLGSDKIDWFEVSFQFKIKDVVLALAELSQLVKEGYLRKDGHIVALTKDDADFIRDFLGSVRLKKDHEKALTSRHHLPFFAREGINIRLPESLADLPSDLETARAAKKALSDVAIPGGLDKVLRNYQKTGIYWLHFLHRYGFGGILADEMGLGKTLQVLTFLWTIQGNGTALIVCPTSLVYNWVAEIRKFIGLALSVTVIDGTKAERERKIKECRDFDIAITSYPLIHNDSEFYQEVEFSYCILDEAQHIKNKEAKRTQSIKAIRARNKIAMTGTPLENNVSELWSIFDFLMPDFLGSHQYFRKHIEAPLAAFDVKERNSAMQKLKTAIKPFVLRRTKANVLKELPPKIEQDIVLELFEKQKAVYLETLSNVRNQVFQAIENRGMEKSAIDFLAALTRLRQICLHPALADPGYLETQDISIKMKAFMELIYESIDSGHRVVVFSQFVEMLKIIRKALHDEKIEYSYIDGQTKNRVGLVEHFNVSDIPIFLVSLKAGGVGLNLIGADSVILFDPWWNPAVEAQAVDRVHRLGQVNTVNVYRLITRGTIEEKIKKLQGFKQEVFDSLIASNQSFIKSMKLDDIRELLAME